MRKGARALQRQSVPEPERPPARSGCGAVHNQRVAVKRRCGSCGASTPLPGAPASVAVFETPAANSDGANTHPDRDQLRLTRLQDLREEEMARLRRVQPLANAAVEG